MSLFPSNFMSPFSLKTWIDENRHLLKPPVNNQVLYKNTEFIVMVVAGPNARKDYHINQSEEFFYQLEGGIILKIYDQGRFRDIAIGQGEVFLLPGSVPHSPQRPAGTLGLVIERRRRPEEIDGLQWYCDSCQTKLYEEFFHLTDITTQFPSIFQKFYSNEMLTTCQKCGMKNVQN